MNQKASISIINPKFIWESTVFSYAIVLFSTNKIFGIFLILASFVSPIAGLLALLSVILANLFASILGLDKTAIQKGYFGYDAMLVTSGLATFYTCNSTLLLVIACVSLFSVFISLTVNGVLEKYKLPALSFPFLITIWIILAATAIIPSIEVHPSRIYGLNENFKIGGFAYLQFLKDLDQFPIPELVKVYLKTLSTLFFQTNIIAGFLIAFGLLIFSRIAFLLSIIGFVSAFYCYQLFGGKVTDFYVNYIGLNYIFQAIAIGGFFLIPSVSSYLAVILLTPLLTIIVFASNGILFYLNLGTYSLPFTIVVLLFLFALKFRTFVNYLHLVQFQTFSPEKNLYNFLNANQRVRQFNYFQIHLPVWGKWTISQAHDGDITHLGEWSKAFDFIVNDDEKKSYQLPGLKVEDYFCYDKPVVACANGTVVAIADGIDDNSVSDVNTIQNWGNSIVLWHTTGLYSQVSHLKKDSLKVKVGDFVKRDDIIALCGSSGRSPEPHLHFQLQATEQIGAPTLDFPIAYYMQRFEGTWSLKTYEKPKVGEIISNVQVNPLLVKAYDFIPGKKLKFEITANGKTTEENWEVFTDAYNYSYLFCLETKAYAYFYNDDNMIRFTNFVGDQTSLLYYFYLANYKVLLGFYKELVIQEDYPVATLGIRAMNYVQDFVAPFYRAVKSMYSLTYFEIDDIHLTSKILLKSTADVKVFGLKQKSFSFETEIRQNRIDTFTIRNGGKTITARCIS